MQNSDVTQSTRREVKWTSIEPTASPNRTRPETSNPTSVTDAQRDQDQTAPRRNGRNDQFGDKPRPYGNQEAYSPSLHNNLNNIVNIINAINFQLGLNRQVIYTAPEGSSQRLVTTFNTYVPRNSQSMIYSTHQAMVVEPEPADPLEAKAVEPISFILHNPYIILNKNMSVCLNSDTIRAIACHSTHTLAHLSGQTPPSGTITTLGKPQQQQYRTTNMVAHEW